MRSGSPIKINELQYRYECSAESVYFLMHFRYRTDLLVRVEILRFCPTNLNPIDVSITALDFFCSFVNYDLISLQR